MGYNFIRGANCRLVTVLFLTFVVSSVSAMVFNVTATNDTANNTGLRGAIIAANKLGGNNTIQLGLAPRRHGLPQPWVFHLTIAGADEARSRRGDMDVTEGNLTIIGLSSNVVIDATGLGDRVFQVFPNARLTLQNLTIAGGTAPGAQFGSFYAPTLPAGEGGAIYNAGKLILNNCVITNNSSGGGAGNPGNAGGKAGGDGGGIYNSGTLTMNNCMVAGNSSGEGVDGAYGGNGGGIQNDGTCFLTDCAIDENQTGTGGGAEGNAAGFGGSGGNGGGICNSGNITLNNCFIGENNTGPGANGGTQSGIFSNPASGPGGAGGSGGGIYNIGTATLNACNCSSNYCGTASGNQMGSNSGGNGGGIYNGGTMRLVQSTVGNNYGGTGGKGVNFNQGFPGGGRGFDGGMSGGTGGSGGGIFNLGKLSFSLCTISGNISGFGGNGGANGGLGGTGGGGGGIYNAGSITLNSCTLAGNAGGGGGIGGDAGEFPAGSGGNGGAGGGLLNAGSSSLMQIKNTLAALNAVGAAGDGGAGSPNGLDGLGPDLAGDFTSQGFNLISISDGSTGFTNGIHADQVGTDAAPINPQLGPLQMNGGPTPTHALLPGSPAIDQGNSFGLHTDQRGDPRPFNNLFIPNAPGGDGSDIGAFELEQ